MTATCLVCGTRTDPGVVCTSCGTPVPGDAQEAAEPFGQREYWESIQERLTRAAAPKYHVTGLIGHGGMAGVFAADEPRLGRRVAMKVLSPALMMDARLIERFMQEARTIAQLSHPNIVAIHDVDERDGLYWFTMTYVPGRTLGQVMRETVVPIPVTVVRAWLHQIGGALAFAHVHGIVHRDVKPINVLLDLLGNAMVTDFGIAKLADIDQGLTRTGLLIGTPAYMSPEQCSGRPITAASDQYSLGAMLYQLLTDTPPFTGQTLVVLQAHMSEPPRVIRDLRPDCPDDLAASIHRMLEKRPEDRWPSLAAALTAAGATPPGFDDPVRVRIEELAASAARLNVAPQSARLLEGSRERVRVTVEDGSGRVLTGRRIEWRSSQPAVAVVAVDELLALSPGSTELTASCGGASLSFEVAVEADPVGAVEVRPASAVVHAGAQVRLDAGVADPDGTRLGGRVLLWSTSDPAVARVSAAGVVTGVAPGDAAITARSGGKYAASTLTVMPAPAVSLTTADEPLRATRESDSVASPKARKATLAERARRVWRDGAVVIADAATRGRRRATLALMSTGRRAAEIAGAVARGCRRAMLALMSTGRRAAGMIASAAARARRRATLALMSTGRRFAGIAGAAASARRRAMLALMPTGRRFAGIATAATRALRRAVLALTRRRRRSVAIISAATVVALAVAGVIVSLRIPTPGGAGQAEATPAIEPTPIAPTDAGDAEPTTAELEAPSPDAQRAPVDTGPAEPASAAAPVMDARILVAGDLPAAATVVVSDARGRTWPLSSQPIALAPGRYTVEFRAPGYESEREDIVLTSGRTERWTPDMRPVRVTEPAPAPPAPAPPTPDAEAAREAVVAAIVAAVRPFVAAFDRRDTDVVLPALPPSEHERWRRVLQSDEVTDFSATLLPTTSMRIEGNLASVSFSVTVSYQDENEPQGAHVTFFGYAERRDDGWQLYDLEHVSTQDFR